MKIKITTGFSADEKFIIDSDEAHKAYYLFNNPEMRGTFSNGVAIIGKNIQGIQPAWNESKGWNPTHKLDDDDWNDIRRTGLDERMEKILAKARDVAHIAENNLKLLEQDLSEIQVILPTEKNTKLLEETKNLSDKFQIK